MKPKRICVVIAVFIKQRWLLRISNASNKNLTQIEINLKRIASEQFFSEMTALIKLNLFFPDERQSRIYVCWRAR